MGTGDHGTTRRRLSWLAGVVTLVGMLYAAWRVFVVQPFPPDTTPQGAYLRIAKNLGDDHPREVFAYLETDAQWAAYSIRDLRKEALGAVRTGYPAAEGAPLVAAYGPEGEAADGADVFVLQARKRGWIGRLRRDLSGIKSVEVEGQRATVVTVRGTRYPFRRRDNGIWGLTLFTADLVAEKERAARDLDMVRAAAADYARAPPGDGGAR